MTCYLATVMVNNKIDDDKQMHLCRGPFRRPCGCAGAIQTASSDVACPGLLWKPLDAGIGQLLTPYCPSGCQGNKQTNNNQQMTLKRWPNRWPWQCAGTLLRTLPNGGGLGLSKMPLNATIGRVLQPIMTIGHACAVFLCFHRQHHRKRLQVDAKAPVFNKGITY
jgi:hypothetical protein